MLLSDGGGEMRQEQDQRRVEPVLHNELWTTASRTLSFCEQSCVNNTNIVFVILGFCPGGYNMPSVSALMSDLSLTFNLRMFLF